VLRKPGEEPGRKPKRGGSDLASRLGQGRNPRSRRNGTWGEPPGSRGGPARGEIPERRNDQKGQHQGNLGMSAGGETVEVLTKRQGR